MRSNLYFIRHNLKSNWKEERTSSKNVVVVEIKLFINFNPLNSSNTRGSWNKLFLDISYPSKIVIVTPINPELSKITDQ